MGNNFFIITQEGIKQLEHPPRIDILYGICCSSLIFFHLYLLYGIVIAYELAKNNDGAAVLAGAIGVLIAKAVYLSIDKDLNMGVFAST